MNRLRYIIYGRDIDYVVPVVKNYVYLLGSFLSRLGRLPELASSFIALEIISAAPPVGALLLCTGKVNGSVQAEEEGAHLSFLRVFDRLLPSPEVLSPLASPPLFHLGCPLCFHTTLTGGYASIKPRNSVN